ncbi:hypothetical protein [Phenylobacterium soli]|uniref:DUF2793 domain-containing protein n=1 Tax=Phenylobacterium soli TaxID=2170551 RepID=A0A328A947_9CAUL|nr:hypothetical protein [Phenylobacterium soli]RAK51203.1 hypothetical protein DJ017_19795 [Phenylobacterium soli]
MAASTTVFATGSALGVKLGATATSTPAFAALTRFFGNDGHDYLYVKAHGTISSTGTCIIGAAGSASTDSGSAGWTANVPSGAVANQYFFVKRTTLA